MVYYIIRYHSVYCHARQQNHLSFCLFRTFKGSNSDDGTLIKVALDRSGIYAATSCTDKTVAIYDYYTGECMATMFGHSELVTGIRFTEDCKHLISVSGEQVRTCGHWSQTQSPWSQTHSAVLYRSQID